MAKSEAPKVTKLTHGEGDNAVTVSVADENVDALLAGGQFKKTTTTTTTTSRRSSSD